MRSNSNTSVRLNPEGDLPQVDTSAFIDSTAQLIGSVHIGSRVYIGPNAVVRADEVDDEGEVTPIEIGSECNVQDGVIIHALGGTTVTIGCRSSLGHGCIVHGPCTVGEGCFVGFGAKLFDATLGDGVYIGMGAVVQGVELAEKSIVPPAVTLLSRLHVRMFVSKTSSNDRAFMEQVVRANVTLAEGYIRLDGQNEN